MSLINEIKSELTSQTVPIADTLRKAKILASQIKLEEFKQWLKYELDGYPNKQSLPEYRKMMAHNIGTFSGPFNSMARNVPIPTANLPESVKEFAERMAFFDGVGELEAMLKVKGDRLERRWPAEAIILARDRVTLSGGMVLVDASQPIGKHMIAGIIDSVKNRLLDFVLAIEESNIDIGQKGLPPAERDKIRNMFNFNIYGSSNVVAAGETVSQEYRAVSANDIESLMGYLSHLNINSHDLNSLREAISDDGPSRNKTLGTKVLAWLGQMVSKAVSGAWTVALSTAPVVLTEALKKYYGL